MLTYVYYYSTRGSVTVRVLLLDTWVCYCTCITTRHVGLLLGMQLQMWRTDAGHVTETLL
jgi:hypothetical protein